MVVELEYKIEQDEDLQSPREWDNLGTMYCWHSRYNLGDEQPDLSPVDQRVRLVEILDLFPDSYYDDWGNISDGNFEKIEALFEKHYISLPLYLYDHSGITMSTGSFGCPWDSGQVGFIAVSKEDVRKEYSWKVLNKKRIQQIEKYLRNEVETYDQYLTGDVWGYVIENEEYDIYESCWGFYGHDYCEIEAKSMLECEQKALNEKLKIVSRDLPGAEYLYSVRGDELLNEYLMEHWPNECRELDEILERGKQSKELVLDEDIDRYYVVQGFFRRSMRESISRYFNPRR